MGGERPQYKNTKDTPCLFMKKYTNHFFFFCELYLYLF